MGEVRRGRVRIPPFQRGLKWRIDDVVRLFDSLFRGYPIGTLLFWQTEAAPALLKFGALEITGEARADAWWVVDGQQRVTTLARVLFPSDGLVEDEFGLVFDLEEQTFASAVGKARKARLDAEPGRYLPMTEVLDSLRLQTWVAERGLAKERQIVAFLLGKRIREYTIPAYIVESRDEDVLREIFHRVNASGKPLTDDEVFDALHGAKGGSVPADFKQVAASLRDLDFGELGPDVLLRVMLALLGRDPTGSEIPRLASEEAGAAYADTARAVRGAIALLKGHAGIPHETLLPYQQPLVALAKFVHRYPSAAPRSIELLSRWVWRGAQSGAHRGDTVSTRRVLDAIDQGEHEAVQALLADVGQRPPPHELGRFNFRHALSKLEVLALVALGPRHLTTGDILTGDSLFGGPSSLQTVVKDGSSRSDTIANRIIHPPIPHLSQRLLEADSALLASHAVGPDARAALARGDKAAFLEARASTLDTHVRSFLDAKARWEAGDRPPIGALIVPDDN